MEIAGQRSLARFEFAVSRHAAAGPARNYRYIFGSQGIAGLCSRRVLPWRGTVAASQPSVPYKDAFAAVSDGGHRHRCSHLIEDTFPIGCEYYGRFWFAPIPWAYFRGRIKSSLEQFKTRHLLVPAGLCLAASIGFE